MSAELRCIDTNVRVHLFDTDAPAKQAIARELVAAGRFVLSTQVLSESYVTVTRKLARPLDSSTARRAVADLCAMPIRDITAKLVQAGMALT